MKAFEYYLAPDKLIQNDVINGLYDVLVEIGSRAFAYFYCQNSDLTLHSLGISSMYCTDLYIFTEVLYSYIISLVTVTFSKPYYRFIFVVLHTLLIGFQ